MKKSTKILLLITVILISLMTISNAAEATASIRANVTQINAGDTFEVILSAKCENGINSIETAISFDESKIEKISTQVVDSTKWSNLGSADTISVISQTEDSIKEGDIIKVTFKVKDTVVAGTQITINTSDIALDTDEATNSSRIISGKTYTFTVGQAESGKEQENNEQKEAEDNKQKESEQDNKQSEPSPDTLAPTDSKKSDDSNTSKETAKSTTTTGDNSKANKEIAYAGIENVVILCIGIILISATIGYIQYKKYKNI